MKWQDGSDQEWGTPGKYSLEPQVQSRPLASSLGCDFSVPPPGVETQGLCPPSAPARFSGGLEWDHLLFLLLLPRFLFPPTGEGEAECGSRDGGSFLGLCSVVPLYVQISHCFQELKVPEGILGDSSYLWEQDQGSQRPGFWPWLHQSLAEWPQLSPQSPLDLFFFFFFTFFLNGRDQGFGQS